MEGAPDGGTAPVSLTSAPAAASPTAPASAKRNHLAAVAIAFAAACTQMICTAMLSAKEVLGCKTLTKPIDECGGGHNLRDPFLSMRLDVLFKAAAYGGGAAGGGGGSGAASLPDAQAKVVRLVDDIVPAYWPTRPAQEDGAFEKGTLHTLASEVFEALQHELRHFLYWGLKDDNDHRSGYREGHVAEALDVVAAIKRDITAGIGLAGGPEAALQGVAPATHVPPRKCTKGTVTPHCGTVVHAR